MLATSVFIFNPALVSGDVYTADLFFSPATNAKYVRLGDTLTDTSSNTYVVIAPTSLPLSDGSTVTLQATGANVLPQVDSNYDSSIETFGQVDSRPNVSTGGVISASNLLVSHEFTYTISALWDITADANASDIGDRLVDAEGKEYVVSSFSNPSLKWGAPVIVEEVEKVGNSPDIGKAALYRQTGNYSLYQGSELTSTARTVARNRDNYFLDSIVSGLSGGGGSPNGDFTPEDHVVTSGEELAKQFTLSNTPDVPTEVIVNVINGTAQRFGTDFTISGNTFSWSGLGLDGLLEAGDIVRLSYFT